MTTFYFVEDGEVLPVDMLEKVESLQEWNLRWLRRECTVFSVRVWMDARPPEIGMLIFLLITISFLTFLPVWNMYN